MVEILKDVGIPVHAVTSRAKEVPSLRRKLREKRYVDPGRQLTDGIGVRVIVYYPADVDTVSARLQSEFEIDAANSVDKRTALTLHEFGYRSVHLVARLDQARRDKPEYSTLAGKYFELQVRTVLEHAWAEIEHAIIYKGGLEYPDDIRRRFAALAGTLEMLDQEFLRLRAERDTIINSLRDIYRRRRDLHVPLTAGRLIALLEARFPRNPGWRKAPASMRLLPAGIEHSCTEALRCVGLGTARSMLKAMATPRFRRVMRAFASRKGLGPDEVSHLALVVIALGIKKPEVLRLHFSEMLYDSALDEVLRPA